MQKNLLTVILSVLLSFSIGTFVACTNDNDHTANQIMTSQQQEVSKEQKVRDAVSDDAFLERFGRTINGNELKSSRASITNLRWSSETACVVSGVMSFTDVYGTTWQNNYDCVVTTSDNGKTWDAGTFKYKNSYWSRK